MWLAYLPFQPTTTTTTTTTHRTVVLGGRLHFRYTNSNRTWAGAGVVVRGKW
jgi:hypothetical protein